MCAIIFINNYRRKFILRAAEWDTHVSARLSDVTTNHFTVSIFGSVTRECQGFFDIVRTWKHHTKTLWNVSNIMYAIISVAITSIQIGILFTSIWLWSRGDLTAGTFVLILQYMDHLIDRVILPLGNTIKRLYNANGYAQEMINVFETPHEVQDMPDAP